MGPALSQARLECKSRRWQVDLDMLNVALGRGSLELRSALLNTDYLNAQLVWGCRTHALLQ